MIRSRSLAAVGAAAFLTIAGCGSADSSGKGSPIPEQGTSSKLVGASSATVADIVAANVAAEESMHLVARVYPDSTSVFEFYEPSPGKIILSEAGLGSSAPHRYSRSPMTPVQIYQDLVPGEAVPQPLLDAQTRADVLTAAKSTATFVPAPQTTSAFMPGGRSPFPPSTEISTNLSPQGGQIFLCGPPPQNNGHCDPTWFANNMCDPSNSNVNFQWCVYNQGGNSWAQDGSDVAWGYGAACASINNITFQLIADDGGGGSWTVIQGTARWAQPNFSTCSPQPFCDHMWDQNIRYNVFGSGAEFHFCGDFMDWDQ